MAQEALLTGGAVAIALGLVEAIKEIAKRINGRAAGLQSAIDEARHQEKMASCLSDIRDDIREMRKDGVVVCPMSRLRKDLMDGS